VIPRAVAVLYVLQKYYTWGPQLYQQNIVVCHLRQGDWAVFIVTTGHSEATTVAFLFLFGYSWQRSSNNRPEFDGRCTKLGFMLR